MKKPEWPGIATAVGVILILSIITWSGIWGPIQNADLTIHFSDWLTLFSAACTIGAGWLAYHAVQIQIRDARNEIRKTNLNSLNEKVFRLRDEIQRLNVAYGFLTKFADLFPSSESESESESSGFAAALRQARMKALDYISASATNAPFGYGQIISTIMTRVQRIGDRLEDRIAMGGMSTGILSYYDPIVRDAIIRIRTVAAQIRNDLPSHELALVRLSTERDRYDEN